MGSVMEKVQLVKEESARIGVYLKTLKPEQWSIPSACDAWEVQDVVAHVMGAVERFGPNIVRGAGGDGSAPKGCRKRVWETWLPACGPTPRWQ